MRIFNPEHKKDRDRQEKILKKRKEKKTGNTKMQQSKKGKKKTLFILYKC